MTDKNTENEIGFFNKKKNPNTNKKQSDMTYKEIPKPQETYTGVPKSAESSSATSTRTDSDIRKTMRIPEEQFFEFMALLDTSEYAYTYELLGELIDIKLKQLDSSELRDYQNSLASIRRKEEKKKSKKK